VWQSLLETCYVLGAPTELQSQLAKQMKERFVSRQLACSRFSLQLLAEILLPGSQGRTEFCVATASDGPILHFVKKGMNLSAEHIIRHLGCLPTRNYNRFLEFDGFSPQLYDHCLTILLCLLASMKLLVYSCSLLVEIVHKDVPTMDEPLYPTTQLLRNSLLAVKKLFELLDP